jgi:hypothetical protein
MPICEAVRAVLHDGAELGETFASLWSRPIEAEPRTMSLSLDHPAADAAIANLAERIAFMTRHESPVALSIAAKRMVLATDLDGTFLGAASGTVQRCMTGSRSIGIPWA